MSAMQAPYPVYFCWNGWVLRSPRTLDHDELQVWRSERAPTAMRVVYQRSLRTWMAEVAGVKTFAPDTAESKGLKFPYRAWEALDAASEQAKTNIDALLYGPVDSGE